MKLKLPAVLLLAATQTVVASAQNNRQTSLVKGRLFNKITKQPANDVQIIFPNLKLLTITDGEGYFNFSQVPYGTQKMVVGGNTVKSDTITIVISKELVDIGDIQVTPSESGTAATQLTQIPTIAIEDANVSVDDDGVKGSAVSGLLTASRDPFVNTASFTFGQYRFQARGYDRNAQQVLVNGMPMNDVETGDASWNQWGGLNDAFRARNNTYGLTPSDYTFGGMNGSVYFDATAANQRKQTRITYSATNRQYRNRLMLTHSSGLMKNGWAYSLSVSKRWANQGYIAGTFYDAYSYYAGVSKVWKKHQFNFTTFGAPTRRGKSTAATQEAYDLAGSHFYNPNWGYQNGEKRNAKVNQYFQPVFILNYEYKPSDKTDWNTTVGYQFGKNKNSTLDWYNAQDPRPDYYKNMPSYYLNGINNPTPELADQVRAQLMANPNQLQINWDRMYDVNSVNYETIHNVNGIAGNDVYGRRALYVVANDVDDIKKFNFNTNLSHALNEHIILYTGITFITQRTESYKEVADLLGADFYVNYNQFASRDYPGNLDVYQNDLNNPNRILKEGDKYGYDYITHFNKGWWWGQAAFTYNKFDFFVAANAGINSFSREGLYRNGLFPNASYGKGATESFFIYGAKGGATYKINGRNYLFVNAGIGADAPTVDNTYISPRTRSYTIDNPVTQKYQTIEGGYLLKAPNVNARVVGYATDIKDATEIQRFYNDDPNVQSFVNFVSQHVNSRYVGTELALDVKVTPSLSLLGVAAVGEAFYTNRPTIASYKDNDTAVKPTTYTVYNKNYYVSAGPQSSYTAGARYNSKKYWWAGVNFNYFDRNYVAAAPIRRTVDAVDGATPGSAEWNAILAQEKLPSAFTVDINAGTSIMLHKYLKQIPRSTFLYINVGVSNLLDNKDIATGGFEQLRYDFTNNNINKFPNKYFYGYGRNFFVNVSLKF